MPEKDPASECAAVPRTLDGRDAQAPGIRAVDVLLGLAACVALATRIYFESVYLLPAPVGDGILFLASAHNLCSSGFLGTSLFPSDPAGLNRYVWHGFLSPWLYGKLNTTCSVFGYYALWLALTVAMRSGEMAAVAPFRYVLLVWSFLIGAVFFGERPDWATLAGAAIVVGTGLYSFGRERIRQRDRALKSAVEPLP